jgi:hypothetical protein
MHYCSIRVHRGDTPMVGGRCVTPERGCHVMIRQGWGCKSVIHQEWGAGW